MQSEYIFSAESEGSVFGQDDTEAATQVAAAPQTGETLDTPLLPHDAAQVVVTPGQSVVRVPVEPGEVIELPFDPDAHFVARLGDGNLAIKVGDVTVILQGYQADGDNPPVIQAADGTPIDIATILAETDPNIDIQTAAGPGTNAGGQGADNTGALFQQLGGEGGLAGFQGIGSQDDTSNPDGGPGADGGSLLRSLAATNTAPTVSDFDTKTDEDTPLAGQLTGTDPDGDPLTYHTVGAVPAGLTVNPDGTWSFDPTGLYDYLAANDKTSVSFQYQANDGTTDSNIATAHIEIDGVNDKASIKGDLDGAVKEETQETATGTVTVTDADHDQSFAFATSGSSSFGTWEVQADGAWTYHLDSGNATVNALPEGDKLTDTFTVTSLDGSDSQVVTVTITGTNDVPTITGQSTGDVTEDSFFHFATAGKLTVTDPDSGESHMDADAGVSTYGAWVVGKDGTWGYVLNELDPAVHALQAGETATDTFTVTSEDGSQTQDVTITIHGVNDRAIITGDKSGKVTEDSGATVTGTLDVFDLDHDQSHAQVQTDVASQYGTWSVDADGHWSYKLDDTDPDVNALGAGGKLIDTFTVTSLDGTDTQTVKITINGHNDAPVAGDLTLAALNEDTSGAVANVRDVSSDPETASNNLTYSVVGSLPAGVILDADGTVHIDYVGHYDYLAAGQQANISFQYQAFDGQSYSNVATVSGVIKGANDAPVIDSNGGGAAASITIVENTAAVTTVTAADVDKSDTVTYGISGGADASLFSIDQATGALSFKAAPDFEHPLDADGNNVYDVTVRADDGHGGIDTQAIAVTVTDQVLAAANDYIFTTESGLFAVNDSWLLANDEPHSALQIDYVHAGANGGYFDPFVSIIPTPWEALGDVYLDLDTSSGGQDNTYLKNGEHTTFGYTATDGTGSAVAATVEVTYVNSNSIDRSGDTHDDIIVGSSGNEQLTGGSGNDFIDGAGGDDRISGGTGTDSLYGADGDDRISGGAGMDSLYGGRGDDRIFGGAGMDSLYGGDGDDVIRYSKGDNAHGGLDSVASLGFSYDPPGTIFDFDVGLLAAGQRGDVLAFGESVNLTAAKYSGQFDGFETISLKEPDSNVAGSQTLTIGAGNVQAISDHQITLAGVFDGHAAVKIDMDQVDRLYLSISKDGGSWADTGSQTSDGYQIFAHTATGGGEDAYVLVSTPEMSHIVVNKDAPTP